MLNKTRKVRRAAVVFMLLELYSHLRGISNCEFGGKPSPGPSGHPLPQAGEGTRNVLSFFKDSPVQFDPSALRPAKTAEAPKAEFKRGQRVRHDLFGEGTILKMEGSGPDAKLTVYFERAGSKKFIAKYAKLTRI
jgi:ATP-dependent DNA helicase UvrD/PcrA